MIMHDRSAIAEGIRSIVALWTSGRAARLRVAPLVVLAVAALTSCGPSGPASGDGDGASALAPTDVAVDYRVGAVLVTWTDASDGDAAFRLYREDVAEPGLRRHALVPIADLPAGASSYLDESVDVGAGYRYAVAAVTPSGTTSPTGQADEVAVVPASEASFSIGTHRVVPHEGPGRVRTRVSIAWSTVVDGEVTVTVSSPTGEPVWDDGAADPFRRYWVPVEAEPVTGTYELIALFGDGEVVTSYLEVDADDLLPAPSGVVVTEATVERVVAEWDAFPPEIALGAYVDDVDGDDQLAGVQAGASGVVIEADDFREALTAGSLYELHLSGSGGPTIRSWEPPRQLNSMYAPGYAFTVEGP